MPLRSKELTEGAGVAVVYDSVGKDTFEGSLQCIAPRGMMVTFGNASGPVPPFDLGRLGPLGSLFITRPTLMTYTAKRADMVAGANELFEAVLSGAVKIEINQTYPLGRGGRGAPRSRSAQDHGLDGAYTISSTRQHKRTDAYVITI